jgi:hypothetical protein
LSSFSTWIWALEANYVSATAVLMAGSLSLVGIGIMGAVVAAAVTRNAGNK